MYRIPVVKVSIVRDSSVSTEQKKVSSPYDVANVLRAYLGDADREHFIVLFLDTKNKINGIHTVSIGDLSSAMVHPREVFKAAILHNAASIIVAHNHPSGETSPSPEDIAVTKRLVDSGELLGIPVLDHIILGDTTHLSLKDKGYI